ncbi:unnamed protein product [Linum trigynum]|uniref:Uncharacterized protein n=1 Tax=Linum trigynum TaxID=586398 RepID=A0AAV2D3X3_9ROSI
MVQQRNSPRKTWSRAGGWKLMVQRLPWSNVFQKPVLRHGPTSSITTITPLNAIPKLAPLLISMSSQLQIPNSTKWKRINQLQGRPWRVEDSDVREVVLYRAGLVTAATSFVAATSTAFLSGDSSLLSSAIEQNLDVFYSVGAGRLGSRV